MTVEEEKGYEIAEKYLREKYGDDYVDFIETEGQSYLDGLTEGRKLGKEDQWKATEKAQKKTSARIRELEKEKAELKKVLDSYKALDSHYDEIEEDAKRIAEENEQLKAQIEQLSNDNHVLKTSFITQQEQIGKMKDCKAEILQRIDEACIGALNAEVRAIFKKWESAK